MIGEPFGGAAGTGFLWEERLDRWMKDRIKGWMDERQPPKAGWMDGWMDR